MDDEEANLAYHYVNCYTEARRSLPKNSTIEEIIEAAKKIYQFSLGGKSAEIIQLVPIKVEIHE